MKSISVILTIILISLLAIGGYFYFFKYSPIASEMKSKDDEVFKLKALLDKAEADRDVTNARLEEAEKRIEELSSSDEEKVNEIKGTYDALIEELKNEIEEGKIEITTLQEQLTVNVLDQVLFDSGSAEIKPEGIEVLDRVGKILKELDEKTIVVEGHTDNVPISPTLKRKYPTNWELSTARATTVVRYLQEKVGIDPSMLKAAGLSEYRPVADNSTDEGKSRNRRIEIILNPHTG
jgi:chemotaxis protein MotB